MISIIIPTLGTREMELSRLLSSLIKQTYSDLEVIIVSQDNHHIVDKLIKNIPLSVQHVQLEKKGLSFARNQALAYVTGNILTYSDDDCWYLPNSFENVHQFFQEHQADVVTYQIFDPDVKEFYKEYPKSFQYQVRKRDLFRKSSIELFINLRSVRKKDLQFNEKFGLGARYPSGEENIFLYNLSRLKYQISYVPNIIVYHEKPTIESRLSEQMFLSKGPLFKTIYNSPIGFVLLTFLFIKKAKYLKQPVSSYKNAVRELLSYRL